MNRRQFIQLIGGNVAAAALPSSAVEILNRFEDEEEIPEPELARLKVFTDRILAKGLMALRDTPLLPKLLSPDPEPMPGTVIEVPIPRHDLPR